MGITQDKQFTSLHIFAKTVEINMILPVFQYQRTVNHFTFVLLCHKKERMVDRRHDHHLVSFLRETMDGKCQSTDNAGSKRQHFFTNLPSMPFFEPVNNGFGPFFAGKCIAQHFVFQTFLQGVDYKRGCAEIHISHPHRNQVITPPTTLYGIPFYGVRTVTVYYFIKIIVHTA